MVRRAFSSRPSRGRRGRGQGRAGLRARGVHYARREVARFYEKEPLCRRSTRAGRQRRRQGTRAGAGRGGWRDGAARLPGRAGERAAEAAAATATRIRALAGAEPARTRDRDEIGPSRRAKKRWTRRATRTRSRRCSWSSPERRGHPRHGARAAHVRARWSALGLALLAAGRDVRRRRPRLAVQARRMVSLSCARATTTPRSGSSKAEARQASSGRRRRRVALRSRRWPRSGSYSDAGGGGEAVPGAGARLARAVERVRARFRLEPPQDRGRGGLQDGDGR